MEPPTPTPTLPLPSALRAAARWERLTDARIPVMLVHPDWDASDPVPVVLWMHGRTVSKELDAGRYLRWMRSGIASCAIDLPGHGERFDAELQPPDQTFDIVRQMIDEIDGVVDAIRDIDGLDERRIAIGGMSAGGMATLARLCRPHEFVCASVEATSGSWRHQMEREMFHHRTLEEIDELDPLTRLDGWRDIPLQAFHSRLDEWVAFDGQQTFIDAVRARAETPYDTVDFVVYDQTGAPNEHAGFGRKTADAKVRQLTFLRRWLLDDADAASDG